MAEQLKSPSRQDIALALHPLSKISYTQIRHLGERELMPELVRSDIHIPRGFVVTPFDELALGFYLNPSAKQLNHHSRLEPSYIPKQISTIFGHAGFDVSVSRADMENYFERFRGIYLNKDKNRFHVGHFPEIRDRYNVAAMLNRGIFPDYKREVQYAIASLFSEGASQASVAKVLKVPTIYIVQSMLLDLFEEDPQNIIQRIVSELNTVKTTQVDDLETFILSIQSGRILTPVPKTLLNVVPHLLNPFVSQLWLESLESSQQDITVNGKTSRGTRKFSIENSPFWQNVLRAFVIGRKPNDDRPKGNKKIGEGASAVNSLLEEQFGTAQNVGSMMAKIIVGSDFIGVPSPEIYDNFRAR